MQGSVLHLVSASGARFLDLILVSRARLWTSLDMEKERYNWQVGTLVKRAPGPTGPEG